VIGLPYEFSAGDASSCHGEQPDGNIESTGERCKCSEDREFSEEILQVKFAPGNRRELTANLRTTARPALTFFVNPACRIGLY
jgi:hypothetical protein